MQITIFHIELIRSCVMDLGFFFFFQCSSGYIVKPDCLTSYVRWNLSVNTSDLEANRKAWLISSPLSGSVSRNGSKINQFVNSLARALIDMVFITIWLSCVFCFKVSLRLNQDTDPDRNHLGARWGKTYLWPRWGQLYLVIKWIADITSSLAVTQRILSSMLLLFIFIYPFLMVFCLFFFVGCLHHGRAHHLIIRNKQELKRNEQNKRMNIFAR